MERKYEHPTGLAAALTGGAVYILCSAAVALWPAQSVRFISTWFHGIDISQIAVDPAITIGSFLVGLVEVLIFFYLIGFGYAWIYNQCLSHCKKRKWIN